MPQAPDALQLCPNDHPPFADICAGHAKALRMLGLTVYTVFFERRSPRSLAGPDVAYMPAAELARAFDGGSLRLLLSHRYRAYRAGLGLHRRCEIGRHVAVLHEYGTFAHPGRRLRQRLRPGLHKSRRLVFAGVSPPVAEELRRVGLRTAVLPNPVDVDALRGALLSRAAARRALDLPQAAFVVGVLGRLHPKKDLLRALRAFNRYRQENGDACLAFVGDGELRDALQREAGPGVHFAGFRADALALLSAFDALLSCADGREAFGMAPLEALAAGVPVLAAEQPGPRYALGDCATWFRDDGELLAALRRLAKGANGDQQAAARTHVETFFSTTALARRHAQLLGMADDVVASGAS